MPYPTGNPLAAALARKFEPLDQVANAKDATATVNLTPASQARAAATRAGWEPLLYGQKIPRVGERVDAEPDDGR